MTTISSISVKPSLHALSDLRATPVAGERRQELITISLLIADDVVAALDPVGAERLERVGISVALIEIRGAPRILRQVLYVSVGRIVGRSAAGGRRGHEGLQALIGGR